MTGKRITISKIKLHNFRPYHDYELELSQDPQKTMTIVCGNNSRGKTAIMNSIYWALYGEEPFWMNGGVGKPIINQFALNNTAVGKSTDASATIEFSDEKGPKISITRKVIAKRETDSKNKISSDEAGGQIDDGFACFTTCEYQERKKDGSWLVADDETEINGYVQKFLPQSISEFVIFNGEILDKFFKADSARIRDGIENVSGLGITQEAIQNCEKIIRDFSKHEAKNSGSKANTLQAQKDLAEAKWKEHRIDQKNDQAAWEQILIAEEKLKMELEKFPEAKMDTLEELLEQAKVNQKNIEDLKLGSKEKRIHLIIPNLSNLLLRDLLAETQKILLESELRGDTPPVVMPEFIDQKLKAGTCMCGKKLDSSAMKELNDLKSTVKNAELSEIANEGKIILARLFDDLENLNLKADLKDLHQKIQDYEADLSKVEASINSYITTLNEHKIEDIRRTSKDYKDLLFDKNTLKTSIDRRQVLIESYQNKTNEIQEEIDELSKVSSAAKLWISKRKLAEKIRDVLVDLREAVLKEIRQTVEKRTEELWTKLIARGSEIEKVMIDEDYNIRVIDKDGSDSLKSLSAGQSLYLALSFIAAVRDVTDTNYPMIIDSPFGKIDGPSREEAAKTIPKYIPDTQVTLLVTDSEYYATVENKETGKIYPPIDSVLKSEKRIWKVENLTLEDVAPGISKTTVGKKKK